MISLTRGTNEYLQKVAGLTLPPEAKSAIVDNIMKNPHIVRQYITGLGDQSGVTMASHARKAAELQGVNSNLHRELMNLEAENARLRNQVKHLERILEYDKMQV
jgi:hypothetical protein